MELVTATARYLSVCRRHLDDVLRRPPTAANRLAALVPFDQSDAAIRAMVDELRSWPDAPEPAAIAAGFLPLIDVILAEIQVCRAQVVEHLDERREQSRNPADWWKTGDGPPGFNPEPDE
jgi:hypothetical protein